MDILDKVKIFCSRYHLVQRGDKILLAVSGGPDSVALLNIFNSLITEFGIRIAVVHLEHGLRQRDSLQDQRLVEEMAKSLGVSFYTKNVKIDAERERGESREEAARRVRYNFFLHTMERIHFNKIATGHTLDDNVETILYRLISGTGPTGFTGIHPGSGHIIHPLLNLSKKEIMDFLHQKGLKYSIDKSNIETSIIRNRIRQDIIPIIRSINPRFREHILNLSSMVQDVNSIVEAIVDNRLKSILLENSKDIVRIDYNKFSPMEDYIKRRIIIKIIESLIVSMDFTKKVYLPYSIAFYLSNYKGAGNKVLYQNNLIKVQKEYGILSFKKRVVNDIHRKYLYNVDISDGSLYIIEIKRKINFSKIDSCEFFEKNKIYFDYDELVFPLIIRSRRPGDRIVLPKIGEKKLKFIFINDKIPKDIRDCVPIIVSKNEIIGIFCSCYGRNNRIARDYMITDKTKRTFVCELD